MSESIIYEQHPVSAERKSYLRRKGYKIIDAKFAPDGYEHPEPIKEGKVSKASKSAAEKKAAEEAELKAKLQVALTEKGVQFGPEASLEDLQKLLDGAA
ncbi:hypothetical protein [Pseudomonas sp. BJP69]|uniref:hypothetical protein n=1 Tax=Pseudomonas sp. BJP69 TaxID=2597770 RepID=UPI00118441F9|nr:hypothetical protein [Pseudomonas sp. BJP69]QDR69228.1 hypothetical protein FPB55_17135 [Pseudomonas sp. BJP69]WHL28095.1 hypothetical protein QJS63_28440 [Pseudomonas juntendi]